MTMLVHSEMWQFPVPEQLFLYASAYRTASSVLCQKMTNDTSCRTWPIGAVVLMLSAHAVELFLKGALLKRDPTLDVWSYGHSIDSLSAAYRSQFLDASFAWDIPFASSLTEAEWIKVMQDLNPSLSDAELKGLRSASPAPSILYRYPVDKGGKEWRGLYGFEPGSFLSLLSQMEKDFERIKSQLLS